MSEAAVEVEAVVNLEATRYGLEITRNKDGKPQRVHLGSGKRIIDLMRFYRRGATLVVKSGGSWCAAGGADLEVFRQHISESDRSRAARREAGRTRGCGGNTY